ncbi:hypothetical protein MAPG_11125 [Magnaporthiopsis poae ATCC 64411]|uniref:Uncharacterized protein n=1 Tax=Magnaporthiopsis poae (strain ATCC 64411 / 73-15) TaxID=644358 RepID=A0A0C4EEF2_MAGP6|nr:hypothetical protein MAPG_11125 [Magnaporthiopsis poae ATCC 64411]
MTTGAGGQQVAAGQACRARLSHLRLPAAMMAAKIPGQQRNGGWVGVLCVVQQTRPLRQMITTALAIFDLGIRDFVHVRGGNADVRLARMQGNDGILKQSHGHQPNLPIPVEMGRPGSCRAIRFHRSPMVGGRADDGDEEKGWAF